MYIYKYIYIYLGLFVVFVSFFLIVNILSVLYMQHIWKKVQLEKFTKYFNSYDYYKYVQHNTILDKYFFTFLLCFFFF